MDLLDLNGNETFKKACVSLLQGMDITLGVSSIELVSTKINFFRYRVSCPRVTLIKDVPIYPENTDCGGKQYFCLLWNTILAVTIFYEMCTSPKCGKYF